MEASPFSTARGRARNSLEAGHDDTNRQSQTQTEQGTAWRQAMIMASQGILASRGCKSEHHLKGLEIGFRIQAIGYKSEHHLKGRDIVPGNLPN